MSAEVIARLAQFPAAVRVRDALNAGMDVSPWLSSRIRTAKQNPKADMMFSDWQIVHFHLGSVFATPRMIGRTDDLLFAYITGNEATLIDVQPHGSWTMTVLLEILLRINPMAGYQAKGLKGERFTDEQYRNLRAKHTNVLIDINGIALMPGGGVMSSGHATRIMNYYQWFSRQLEFLKASFMADKVPDELKAPIYATIGVPVRLGVVYRNEGLAIIDKNRRGLVLHGMRPLE